jgi:hypothetical protein
MAHNERRALTARTVVRMPIDHVGLGVPDVEGAKVYYDEFMPLVGFVREWETCTGRPTGKEPRSSFTDA